MWDAIDKDYHKPSKSPGATLFFTIDLILENYILLWWRIQGGGKDVGMNLPEGGLSRPACKTKIGAGRLRENVGMLKMLVPNCNPAQQ